MPSEPVNGMRVEDVHEAVARAAERARAGEGPTLLEFKTYRLQGHSMSDPAKYRTKEVLEDYRHRDAIEGVRPPSSRRTWPTRQTWTPSTSA